MLRLKPLRKMKFHGAAADFDLSGPVRRVSWCSVRILAAAALTDYLVIIENGHERDNVLCG
jgi:hypothetical protein